MLNIFFYSHPPTEMLPIGIILAIFMKPLPIKFYWIIRDILVFGTALAAIGAILLMGNLLSPYTIPTQPNQWLLESGILIMLWCRQLGQWKKWDDDDDDDGGQEDDLPSGPWDWDDFSKKIHELGREKVRN